MPFTDLSTTSVPPKHYRLDKDLVYVHPANGATIRVPAGFVTDFASVPRALRPLMTGHGADRKPAVLHDYQYREGIASRKDADLLFRGTMLEEGVPEWKAWGAYWGVRVGAWLTWKKYRKQKKAP